jgi:hypothetical protein
MSMMLVWNEGLGRLILIPRAYDINNYLSSSFDVSGATSSSTSASG